MKICFIADGNHANAATWLEYLATELGHDVHVISCTRVTRKIDGVIVHDLTTGNKCLLLARIPALRKLFRQINPDLLVAYRVQSYGFLAACTGFHPLIVVAQSGAVSWPPDSRIMALFCTYAVRRADWILSWAEHTTRRLVQLGANQDTIDTLPKGVRPELFFPQDERPTSSSCTLITTRTLEPEYNYEHIIHAVRDLLEGMPELKYLIAGEGRHRVDLETLVRQLGLSGRVEFLGYVPHQRLPVRLREADVYVSGSVDDGVSMSLLEAMACGVLPVVPDTAPNHIWIQHGVNGLLFRPSDHTSLVSTLREALSNRSLQQTAREYNTRLIREKVNWHTNMRCIEARFIQTIDAFRERQNRHVLASPHAIGQSAERGIVRYRSQ